MIKPTKEIRDKNKESVVKALANIKEILDKGNVEDQFRNRDGNYYSSEKFIVSWNGFWNLMVAEYSVDKVDDFYASYSGYKAIYSRRNLFYEKMIKGYPSIEYALIDIGVKLSPAKEKKAFFDKYAVPYNERIKAKQNEKESGRTT